MPTYGGTLDRTVLLRQAIEKTRAKVTTRNNLVQKIAGCKWEPNLHTVRSSVIALCYYAAEYASPVWEPLAQTPKLNVPLNNTSGLITGCLKPTTTSQLYLHHDGVFCPPSPH